MRLDSFPTVVERGLNVSVVDADKQLFYIHAFLSAAEAEAIWQRVKAGEKEAGEKLAVVKAEIEIVDGN